MVVLSRCGVGTMIITSGEVVYLEKHTNTTCMLQVSWVDFCLISLCPLAVVFLLSEISKWFGFEIFWTKMSLGVLTVNDKNVALALKGLINRCTILEMCCFITQLVEYSFLTIGVPCWKPSLLGTHCLSPCWEVEVVTTTISSSVWIFCITFWHWTVTMGRYLPLPFLNKFVIILHDM